MRISVIEEINYFRYFARVKFDIETHIFHGMFFLIVINHIGFKDREIFAFIQQQYAVAKGKNQTLTFRLWPWSRRRNLIGRPDLILFDHISRESRDTVR